MLGGIFTEQYEAAASGYVRPVRRSGSFACLSRVVRNPDGGAFRMSGTGQGHIYMSTISQPVEAVRLVLALA